MMAARLEFNASEPSIEPYDVQPTEAQARCLSCHFNSVMQPPRKTQHSVPCTHCLDHLKSISEHLSGTGPSQQVTNWFDRILPGTGFA